MNPQLYFRSGRFFHQFLELGFISYPSPLDEEAPFYAKLILLAFVGGLEFVIASWAADCIVLVPLVFLGTSDWLLGKALQGQISNNQYRDTAILLLSIAEFVWRSKGMWRSMTRQGRVVVFHRLIAAFIWHNPTLMAFTTFRIWACITGSEPFRPSMPRFAWLLLAPTMEMGEIQLDATSSKDKS
jgi:hypothetical protein